MKWDYAEDLTDFDVRGEGLFIANEGNFQYGNATLSYYDPASSEVLNEVFYKANGMRLGDVAQSMTIHDGKCWIVVNNSHVIFAIDADSFRETGRIENLTSPRYIHFVSDNKAYVSQLWDNRIFIVDPKSYSVTGHIIVPDMAPENGSTEQMVQIGNDVYCTCWSYQNRIIRIDTQSDTVTGSLEVGVQPSSLVVDKNGYLWCLTDGGYPGSPQGHDLPALVCVDPDSFSVVRKFRFRSSDTPSALVTNGSGDTLYWINGGVYEMDISSSVLPYAPFIEKENSKFYALTANPVRGDIYVADAIDYMQQGIVYRYDSVGRFIDQFYAGVTPGAFCWK